MLGSRIVIMFSVCALMLFLGLALLTELFKGREK